MSRVKSGYTKKKYFKLKDGESTFRILPTLKELGINDKEKEWAQYYAVHYGYKTTDGKLRVFESSLEVNRTTKMVEVPDAADQRIKDLKSKLEAAKSAGQKEVVERLGKLVSGQKPMYNLDKNSYMNAIDTQGNIGILKLRHRAKKKLDARIKELEARNPSVDPLSSDNGRFFVFKRSGTGLDTDFAVDILQETLQIENVGPVQRDVVHKLTPDIVNRMKDEAGELSRLFKKLSSDDIQRIVTTSELSTGRSPVIDELFSSQNDGDSDEGEEESNSEEVAPTPPVVTQSTAPVTPVATVVVPPPAPKASAAEAALPQTSAESISGQTDEEFLKSLGL